MDSGWDVALTLFQGHTEPIRGHTVTEFDTSQPGTGFPRDLCSTVSAL